MAAKQVHLFMPTVAKELSNRDTTGWNLLNYTDCWQHYLLALDRPRITLRLKLESHQSLTEVAQGNVFNLSWIKVHGNYGGNRIANCTLWYANINVCNNLLSPC